MVKAEIISALQRVRDPELPMLSIYDLGIVRDVKLQDAHVTVVITPTFSGCPVLAYMERDIGIELRKSGFASFTVRRQLAPPWRSTDVTKQGRALLKENGISFEDDEVLCPHCKSDRIVMMSEFGSTSCKRFARCMSCREPFEVFKSH